MIVMTAPEASGSGVNQLASSGLGVSIVSRVRVADVRRDPGSRRPWWYAALCCGLALCACSGSEDERPRNLLLISADSLRADRLALFDPTGPVDSPTLSRLAERGVVYTNAWTVTPWTAPAMVSVFTGLFPPSHGVQVRDDTTPAALPTLPRLAEAAGLRVGNFSFFSGISYFRNLGLPPPPDGLQHGREPVVFARWLDEAPGRDFFAWIHLLEPHLPYGASGYRAKELQVAGSSGLEATQLKATVPVGSAEFASDDRRLLLDLYDQDIERLELRLAELVDALEERDLLDSTLVVFVADHGEELLEDGWVGHASTAAHAKLIPEIGRIPLLVSGPGVADPGTRREVLVQQVDLFPAVARLFGWSLPPAVDGLGLPGVERRRFLGAVPRRHLAYFDSSVGGNLTADERRAERLQGASDGACLLESRTAPGQPEERSAVSLGGPTACDEEALGRALDAWRQQQAGQRLDVLQRAGTTAAPDLGAAETFAEGFGVTSPEDGATLDWQADGGLIALVWDAASSSAPVWVQYEVGEGMLTVRGAFEVAQPGGISFGPFPQGFWNDLAGYSPFRFRVIDERNRARSAWRRFDLASTSDGEP